MVFERILTVKDCCFVTLFLLTFVVYVATWSWLFVFSQRIRPAIFSLKPTSRLFAAMTRKSWSSTVEPRLTYPFSLCEWYSYGTPFSGRGLYLITRMLQNSFGLLIKSGLTNVFLVLRSAVLYIYIYIYIYQCVFAYNLRVQCYTIFSIHVSYPLTLVRSPQISNRENREFWASILQPVYYSLNRWTQYPL